MAGVFAICDLDCVPIYLGQATGHRGDTIRRRVQRHLTSARSDVIANRQLDVWEVAHVWGWAEDDPAARTSLEAALFHHFDGGTRLVNGTVPAAPARQMSDMPEPVKIQILPQAAIDARRDPAIRFPRQVQQFHQLLDYILNTQDKPHLRRALTVHHERLNRHLKEFLRTHPPPADDSADGG